MTDNRILRSEDWDRRRRLCKRFGMRAAVVYAGTSPSGGRLIACDQRIRVKTWANAKLGPPLHTVRIGVGTDDYQYQNTDSEWYQGYNTQGEYVIAFQNPRWRDWALIL